VGTSWTNERRTDNDIHILVSPAFSKIKSKIVSLLVQESKVNDLVHPKRFCVFVVLFCERMYGLSRSHNVFLGESATIRTVKSQDLFPSFLRAKDLEVFHVKETRMLATRETTLNPRQGPLYGGLRLNGTIVADDSHFEWLVYGRLKANSWERDHIRIR
jgi:hypothetical protein